MLLEFARYEVSENDNYSEEEASPSPLGGESARVQNEREREMYPEWRMGHLSYRLRDE